MIYVNNGIVQVQGEDGKIIQDWCILTDAIFKQMFNEDYEEKLKETIKFIVDNSNDFDEIREGSTI